MQPSKLIHWAFWSFIFLYPFFKFFFHHQYPLTTWEFLLPCFFFILIFGLLALFLKNGAVDIIYLVLFYFLLSFVFGNLAWGEFVGMAFLFFGLFVCLKEANLFFSRMAGVFIAGILFVDVILAISNKIHQDPTPQIPKDISLLDKKNILYLIVDEHIGVDGMPLSVPQTQGMKQKLDSFYEKYHFTLFPKAYSRYFQSNDSIPNTLNGTDLPQGQAYFGKERREGALLASNQFFENLKKEGYRIHVYQTNYLDFCNSFVDECHRFSKNSPLAINDKSYLLIERIFVTSSLYLYTNSIFKEVLKSFSPDTFPSITGSLNVVPHMLEEIGEDARAHKSGTLFFAHILMPHYPYVYDPSCKPRPVSQWKGRAEFSGDSPKNSISSYQERYGLYYEQMDCLYSLLGSLFDGFINQGDFNGMTLVVHGDHGSRINLEYDPFAKFKDRISAQDILTSFSTLLAIKKSFQLQGTINSNEGGLNAILKEELNDREFTGENDGVVYFAESPGSVKLVPYPMVLF
ncbi:MAG TPA: hypothetical protein DDW49_08605 [Deltaproteobacteria bacterium]|nr:MAG: hypothetical protein A2048_03375 [Deltaproteobacteria bacterium GWA2_45_12]HBF13425.1 hypothetical protein [Deltaproteobacteria bacterium]